MRTASGTASLSKTHMGLPAHLDELAEASHESLAPGDPERIRRSAGVTVSLAESRPTVRAAPSAHRGIRHLLRQFRLNQGRREAVTMTSSPPLLRSRRNNRARQQPDAILFCGDCNPWPPPRLVCAGARRRPALDGSCPRAGKSKRSSDPCGVTDARGPAGPVLGKKLRLGESPHPAKGANAPIRLHAREQKSD